MNDFPTAMIKDAEKKAYLNSPEWAQLLEKGRTEENKSYSVIYRDVDGSLKEAWHFISVSDVDYIKAKYTKAKKDVLKIIEKEKDFGGLLKTMKGSSKDENNR